MKQMFVRKRIGWGISPGDWRGWSLTGVYVVAMAGIGTLGHGAATAIAMGVQAVTFVAFAIWAFVNRI